MKRLFIIIVVLLSLVSCKEHTLSLKFLDEFVYPTNQYIDSTLIGGLSGVDFYNGKYYFVVDDAKNPRYLTADIQINNDTISSVIFTKVVQLNDSTTKFYKNNALDLESIFVDENTAEINFVSEGSIRHNKKPLIFKTDTLGKFIKNYPLPINLSKTNNLKHNATFEASSKSVDNKGFWGGMEGVMHSDGEEPTFTETKSPIRITYFDTTSSKPTKQYAYHLDKIDNPPKGDINLNGVTALLEYEKNRFFVIERAYQNGYRSYGNTIKIYDAWVTKNTTNTLKVDSLINTNYQPLQKRLLFNSTSMKDQLQHGFIDNIEGITLGPKLSNGNNSLLLVADDNFQKYGKQLNQFILLEITK